MSNADVFRTYLARFTSGDRDGAAELLTEDFRFHGPMLRSEGRAAFLEGSAGLCPIMRGADVHRQWEQDGEVCSVYDFKIQSPSGEVVPIPMAEWTTFRDGRLASARLIFDTATLNAAMNPAAAS